MPRKKKVRKEPLSYDPINDYVVDMANQLIAKHHPHLADAKMAYLWRNKPLMESGQAVFAKAKKITGEMHALCDKEFLIVIVYPMWNDLKEEEKWAILDHELTHCFVDEDEEGERVCKILPHDFSDFGEIIVRHGLYGNLKVIAEAMKIRKLKKETKVTKAAQEEAPALQ